MSRNKPVLIELDDDQPAAIADAPPIPDNPAPGNPMPDNPADPAAQDQPTIRAFTALFGWRLGWFGRLALALLLGLISLWFSVALWDFTNSLMQRNIWIGRAAMAMLITAAALLFLLLLRELLAIRALQRMDSLQRTALALQNEPDLSETRRFANRLLRLYRSRPDLAWQRQRLQEASADMLDADALLAATETHLLAPLDAQAEQIVQSGARQVAAVTAFVPLALADLAVVLFTNLRMLRKIAEIYGGRAGSFGTWRLMRLVATHLIASGAVAVGDDMLDTLLGGGALARVSRRFGEGVINGALTARVGLAAIEVCRPMPFAAAKRPAVRALVTGGLTGLFSKKQQQHE